MALKLEVGKAYKTRDGKKVDIVNFNSEWLMYKDDNNFCYPENGRLVNILTSGHDIIEEWQDAPAVDLSTLKAGDKVRVRYGAVCDVVNINKIEHNHCFMVELKIPEDKNSQLDYTIKGDVTGVENHYLNIVEIIPQIKQEPAKYSEGDLLTVKLKKFDADALNKNNILIALPEQITEHTPAPKAFDWSTVKSGMAFESISGVPLTALSDMSHIIYYVGPDFSNNDLAIFTTNPNNIEAGTLNNFFKDCLVRSPNNDIEV